MSFIEIVRRARELLREEGRITLRGLKREFDLDDEALEELVEELVDGQQVAAREGKVVSWLGPAAEAQSPATASTPASEPEAIPEAERRHLTVLFCDLVDSTRLAAGMDPEDWRELVRGYQQASAAVIERFGGHIAQYLGDGLLVYFGWPQAHEDDAERAVRAGLGIVDAIAAGDSELAVRVGIHTGPVVVGEMGGGASRETLAMGDTTNVAARLQGEAEPGAVVVSSATLRLIPGIFVTEDLGERELKGVGEVQIHQAIQPSGVRSRLDIAAATGLTPLVGREQEVGLLEDRFAQVTEGNGQAILVCGEAGIGKSRLVSAFRDRLAGRAHTWLECRGSPYTQDSALFPVLELQRQGLLFQPDDPPEVRLEQIEAGVAGAGFDLADAVPIVAGLHDTPLLDRYATPELSPEGMRKKTLAILTEWLLRLGQRQPLVLLMEDLHWMDPSTVELLGQIVEQLPTTSVLLLATFRPDFEPPWGARSYLTPMLLSRLTRAELGDLVRKAARERDLPNAWVEEIVRRSDGVPLFAEELTKSVVESNPKAPAAGKVPEPRIPETLQDSLMARLDALGPVKELAQLGSVLGREFSYDLLLKASPMRQAELDSALEAAVREELFYQRGAPPEASYLFKHALIRDVAYQSLLRSTRQRHHRRAAHSLIERIPEVAQAQPELVAHHLTEAGDTDAAIVHWLRAGERSIQRQENAEAISHLTRGIQLVEQMPEDRERHETELSLQMAIAAPLMELEGYASIEVEHACQRSRVLCDVLGDDDRRLDVLFELMIFENSRGRIQSAIEAGTELLHLAERTGERSHRVQAHFAMGFPLFDHGATQEALDHLDRGLEIYDASSGRASAARFGWDPQVQARGWAARASWQLGHPDQAAARAEDAIEQGRSSAYVHSHAHGLGSAAIVHYLRRERARTLALVDKLLEVADEQELTVWRGAGRVLRGWARAMDGSRDEVGEIQAALGQLASTGFQLGAPYFLGMLAEAQRAVGDRDDALGALEMAFAMAEANDNLFWNSELLRLKGEILLENERVPEECEACLRQSLELARSKEWRSLELRTATSLARLWQTQDKRAEARDLLQPIYDWFTEGFDTQDLKDAKALLDELGA